MRTSDGKFLTAEAQRALREEFVGLSGDTDKPTNLQILNENCGNLNFFFGERVIVQSSSPDWAIRILHSAIFATLR